DAAGPGWQHVGERHNLQREGRKQKRVESEDAPEQRHGRDVEDLVGERPPERPEQQLQQVDGPGQEVSSAYTGGRQKGWDPHRLCNFSPLRAATHRAARSSGTGTLVHYFVGMTEPLVELRFPVLGADVTRATLVEWVRRPGDRVKMGDTVAIL